MKKLLLTALLAAMLFVLAACTITKTITISNNGTGDYCELYYTQSGTEEWSENALPEGTVVSPGSTYDIKVEGSGDFDVNVVTCDGLQQTITVNVP